MVDEKLNSELTMCLCSPERQRILGCDKSNVGSRSRERILLLYFTIMRSHLKECVQLWGPQQKDRDLA